MKFGLQKLILLSATSTLGFFTAVPESGYARTEQKAELVIPPATQPLAILSFIAGAENAARTRAEQEYLACDLGKTRSNGQVDTNTFHDFIVNSALWAPYYFEQLEKQFGKGSVILDPVFVSIDKDGNLFLKGGAETKLAKHRYFFVAYENPYGGQPYSIGHYLSPIFPSISSGIMPESVLTWKDFINSVNEAGKHLQSGKVDTPTFDLAMGPSAKRPEYLHVKFFDKFIDLQTKEINGDKDNNDAAYSYYRTILNIDPIFDNEFILTKKFLTGETKFRSKLSVDLAHYLKDSDYAISVKAVAKERDDAIRRQNAANTMMILGAIMGGLNAASAGMAGAGTATAVSANAAMAQDMAIVGMSAEKANAASMEQLALASENVDLSANGIEVDIGNGELIRAKNVADLREKFRKAVGNLQKNQNIR